MRECEVRFFTKIGESDSFNHGCAVGIRPTLYALLARMDHPASAA